MVVSSRTVAKDFGKQHKDVLKKIEQKVREFGERKIAQSSYLAE